MNMVDIKKIKGKFEEILRQENSKPFIVAVMGQTGVGKSSLINALFNTNLATGAVRPVTKKIEPVTVRGITGHSMLFYDLPGIGESKQADAGYLEEYQRVLEEADIVLWAVHADNRSVTFDIDSLGQILSHFDRANQSVLLSKIAFVMTKADLVTPSPWLLVKQGATGRFLASPKTKQLLQEKQNYYENEFLAQTGYASILHSQTYRDGLGDLSLPNLSADKFNFYYKGAMSAEIVASLSRQYSTHTEVFERLYDNYRFTPCSSSFRYGLDQLLLVIINKLRTTATGRFQEFISRDRLEAFCDLPITKAKMFGNIMVIDRENNNNILFDLSKLTA